MSASPPAGAGLLSADGVASSSLSATAAADWIPLIASFLAQSRADPRAIWSSFTMIIFSEIGDKTFLIAAILSMRQSRLIVFLGAFCSLAVMSVLSAFMGVMFPTLLPKSLTTLLASALFFVFGARMLSEGLAMTGDEIGEEWEEAKKEIEEEQEEHELRTRDSLDLAEAGGPSTAAYPRVEPYPQRSSAAAAGNGDAEAAHHRRGSSSAGRPRQSGFTSNLKEGARNLCGLCVSPTFAQAFVLTFLGEWGDRSQIATIALAAAHNIWLVSFGTIVGHSLCTGVAVLGGSWLATRISVRHVTLGGSILFLIFGFLYLYEAYSEFSAASLQSAAAAPVAAMTAAADKVASVGGGAALAAAGPIGGAGVWSPAPAAATPAGLAGGPVGPAVPPPLPSPAGAGNRVAEAMAGAMNGR